MKRRPLSFAWLFVPPLLALAGAAVIGAPFANADESTIDYVALGDSYSSGVGTPGTSGECGQGPGGYASLWATDQRPASFQLLACSGATTDDVLQSQLPALSADTDLVSITIGGNDAGFFPTVMLCAQSTDAACEQQVTSARTGIARVLPGKLDATYQAIRQRAPSAAVVVMGYPRLFDPTSDCPADGMTTFKRQLLNSAADQLARVISDRAQTAGFTFADVRARFDGHSSCTPNAWINTLSPARISDSFHPNMPGYAQGYLPAMAAAAPPGL